MLAIIGNCSLLGSCSLLGVMFSLGVMGIDDPETSLHYVYTKILQLFEVMMLPSFQLAHHVMHCDVAITSFVMLQLFQGMMLPSFQS